jgi:CheY-like chemotaxis protein
MNGYKNTFKSNNSKKLQYINLLILHSSNQVTDLFRSMLAELGFSNVYAAHSGFEGVRYLREIKIHLIITDWVLQAAQEDPQDSGSVITDKEALLTGIDFVKKIRRWPASPNSLVPIIMFADTVEKLQVMMARDAGVNEVCLRPLNAMDLCRRIIAIIDTPRIFITSESYRGPCRRAQTGKIRFSQKEERRKREIRIITHNETTKWSL